jgi:hypothetical protein
MLGGIRRYGEKEHLFCGDIVDERKRRGAYEKEHKEHQRRIPRRKRSHGISVPQRKTDNRARRHAQSVFAALFHAERIQVHNDEQFGNKNKFI